MIVKPSVMEKTGNGLAGWKSLASAARDLVKDASFVEVCLLRLLPATKYFLHLKHFHRRKSGHVTLGDLLQAGSKIMLGRDFLRGRRVKKTQIGFGHRPRSMLIGVFVHHCHGGLAADALGRIDDVEASAPEAVDHQQGLILPTDEPVSDAAVG